MFDAAERFVSLRESAGPLSLDSLLPCARSHRGSTVVSAAAEAFQRTIYRPGFLQFHPFGFRRPVPVGHGQLREGRVVLATLGFSRAIAGALVFSREPPDVLWAICRGIWRLGGLPELLDPRRVGKRVELREARENSSR